MPETLWSFHGGLHLDDHKVESTSQPIQVAQLQHELVLPLQQSIGESAEPIVQVGDQVARGELLARAPQYVSATLSAPTSGQIIAIEERAIAHPSGLSATCMVLRSDGEDRWSEHLPEPLTEYRTMNNELLRRRVRWAGIVGLGGAGFPTSVKVNPGPGRKIHTLILNAAECEPYISCDDMLMREQPERVLAGADVTRYTVGAERCMIGIEDNKPEAIAALRHALQDSPCAGIEIIEIPTRYPSGGEKQLIRLLTGEEVPADAIPAEIGILCQNVATAAALSDAILAGRPLISRIVTLTGAAVAHPGNYEVRIGSSVREFIESTGGFRQEPGRTILGGPMMGFELPNLDVPITKATNCILAATAEEMPEPPPPLACIRCGKCAEVCPAQLLPQQLYWHARARDLDKVQDYHLFDCIECGCCSHVCPSHIPLVQYYRFAKNEIWAQEESRRQSDHARLRHQAREERLARLERERKSRLRKKKEVLERADAAKTGGEEARKAAIQAAVERAKAKKAAAQQEQKEEQA